MAERQPSGQSELVEAWFCRVCGLEAPEYIGARQGSGVIALPCGHEQPFYDDRSHLRGLGYGIPPSVQRRRK